MLGSLTLEAFISISANRLRTILAMLGIVIGVGSVVALVAIGTGSSRKVEETISKLGSNMLIVTPGARNSKGIVSSGYSDLEVDDVFAIKDMFGVEAAAPTTGSEQSTLVAGSRNWNTQVTGTSSDFFVVRDWNLIDGSYFTEKEEIFGGRVAILGKTVSDKLFGFESPVGRTVRMQNLPFKVIGVLEAKGQSLSGRDQDDSVYIPLQTMQRKIKGTYFPNQVDIIFVKAKKEEWITPLSKDILEMLRHRHNVRAAAEDPFTVQSLTSLTAATSETTKAMSYLLGAIASISLIVGGIGIMNIMLVTVTERTREIGIRKAIGATNKHVLWQFLLESIVISTAGSIIGLTLGVGAGLLVEKFFGMPVALTIWSVLISIIVAVLVGVLSGLYPARRAAKLQPIEALRQVGG